MDCPRIFERKQYQITFVEGKTENTDQKAWLQLLSSTPPKVSRSLSPALYARIYRHNHDWLLQVNRTYATPHANQRTVRVDWDKRDLIVFGLLQEIDVLLSTELDGPRHSKSYYLRMLGHHSSVEKNLFRMPLSSMFLATHAESVDQYQVRRLRNAYTDLRSTYMLPPRWRVLRNATLSEDRLTSTAREYLEHLVSGQR